MDAVDDGGADVARLAGQELRGALEPPRGVLHPAAQAALAPGGEQALGQQRARGEHQQLERALDVGGALGEHARRQHVDLVAAGRADHVAAGGRRGAGAQDRQPRLGGVELGARRVQDDGELAGLGLQAALEARAGVLELGEDAPGVVGVALVVAGDERLGGGLDPAHAGGDCGGYSRPARQASTSWSMNLQRLVRAGTPAEVSVLAVMALILGAGCLASATFPMVADTPRVLLVVLGLVSLAAALTLLVAGADISSLHLHSAVVLLIALHGVMVAVAATERGLMLSALGFTWTAVYVALYFRPRAARLYAALTVAVLGVSLLSARSPTDVTVWVTISTMVWVAVAFLTRLNARLRADAHTDGLTGLLNRTGFIAAAARQRAMARRRGEPLALAVIDLDDFKLVNDGGGHAAGDRLLAELAAVWSASLRPGDLLARFGGDEFVLLVAGATEDQVDRVLARLASAHPAAWTAGAVLCSEAESLDEAIARADTRLYGAKAPGRGAEQREQRASAMWALHPGRA